MIEKSMPNSIWAENYHSCDLIGDEPADGAEPVDDDRRPELPEGPTAVALGFFDGVHRGHQQLMSSLVYTAAERELEPIVFTFERIPAKEHFTSLDREYSGLLQEPDNRARMIRSLGISRIYLQVYSERFRQLGPEQFLDEILYDKLKARHIVSGETFHFGFEAKGDTETLVRWAERRGDVTVHIVKDLYCEGNVISSTLIRRSIVETDFELAARLLGHPFSISGPVIRGRAMGRKGGFPTANVAVPEHQLCPPYGVYVTRTRIGERWYSSVSNIGIRPTVNKTDFVPILETSIFDFSGDLYGRPVEVAFLKYMRPEITFPSFLTMSARIHDDVLEAKDWHRSNEQQLLVDTVYGIPFYWLPSKRFRSAIINITVRERVRGHRQAVSLALLARILSAVSAEYPTRKSFNLRQDELYGSAVGCDFDRQGDLLSLTFYGDGIRSGVDGSRPIKGIVDMTFGMLLQPLLDEVGLLDEAIFNSERRSLQAELRARQQDRSGYALDRSLEMTGGLSITKSIEQLSMVTREEVTEIWRGLLEDASIEVSAAGDLLPERFDQIIELISRLPHNAERLQLIPGRTPAPFMPEKVEPVIEVQELKQSRLVLMYSGLPAYCDQNIAAARLFNMVLGGEQHSLLFGSVREQYGFAYSINSSLLRYERTLLIQASVHPEQLDDVVRLIREILEQMKRGDISEQVLQASRQLMRSRLLAVSDDLTALLNFYDSNRLNGFNICIADAIDANEQVTPTQLAELAAGLEETLLFRLVPAETGTEVYSSTREAER